MRKEEGGSAAASALVAAGLAGMTAWAKEKYGTAKPRKTSAPSRAKSSAMSSRLRGAFGQGRRTVGGMDFEEFASQVTKNNTANVNPVSTTNGGYADLSEMFRSFEADGGKARKAPRKAAKVTRRRHGGDEASAVEAFDSYDDKFATFGGFFDLDKDDEEQDGGKKKKKAAPRHRMRRGGDDFDFEEDFEDDEEQDGGKKKKKAAPRHRMRRGGDDFDFVTELEGGKKSPRRARRAPRRGGSDDDGVNMLPQDAQDMFGGDYDYMNLLNEMEGGKARKTRNRKPAQKKTR